LYDENSDLKIKVAFFEKEIKRNDDENAQYRQQQYKKNADGESRRSLTCKRRLNMKKKLVKKKIMLFKGGRKPQKKL
ncbi:MAG: hypothetical protein EZS28_035931, partial [Streblomastix strix]